MKEDLGLTILIIVLCLVTVLAVGGIVYQCYKEFNTCYDVKVVSVDGDVGFYHCTSYISDKTCYTLQLHDKTKVVLMKNDISNIYFVEVKDNERKK